MFFYIALTSISTTSGLWSTDNTRKYQQIDVYIYQCGFSFCFLVINLLILQKSNGYFQRKLISQGSRGCPTFFRGGPTFSMWGGGGGQGGAQLLFPYINPYNLWFSRGSGPLSPPSGSAHGVVKKYMFVMPSHSHRETFGHNKFHCQSASHCHKLKRSCKVKQSWSEYMFLYKTHSSANRPTEDVFGQIKESL